MKIPNPPSLLRSKPARRILTASAAALLTALAAIPSARSQVVLTGSTTYTQNFDSLGTTTISPWVDNSTILGWYAGINATTPATADGDLTVSDGSVNTLTGLLNLGTTGGADRALGSKSTGVIANIAYGVLFQNTSSRTLDVTNVGYAGELWLPNGTSGIPELWFTYAKSATAAITDPEPGANNATPAAGTFTAVPSLNWSSPASANTGVITSGSNGNAAANRAVIFGAADPNVQIAPGQFFMFKWTDNNTATADGYQAIDDFSIGFANAAVYNLAHTVGGTPNGVLEESANQYWLDGATGSTTKVGFTSGDSIIFSQNPATPATISVPANVTTGQTTVSAASGTYTIGGVGKIAGSLLKSAAGTLVLTSANSFTSTAISGGVVQVQAPGALGAGPVTLATVGVTLRVRDNGAGDNGTLAYGNDVIVANNATLDLDRATGGTSVGNTVALGNLSVGAQTLTVTGANGYKARFDGTTTLTGAATITANTEVILQGAISGAFAITKTGTGRLTINSNANTYTGVTTVGVNGGSIGGNGTVGGALTVSSGATLAPGTSTGIFSTNTNLTLSSGSTLSIDLAHNSAGAPVAGTDYDQVKVGTGTAPNTGTVALTGSNLTLTIGTGVVAGDVFIIILNDLAEPVTGNFTGLLQNATLPGGQFRINYIYNSTTNSETGGNDVALIALPVPEPGTALLALLGAATLLRRRRG